ncbi:MAG TPA: class I SAM-dependent methyltransferase [Tahibacter sp.]|uniref:SAM-dependent methyltransferase n=1 Tax=Tahibacter sp. TaxID=2056211 RepID=UPI002BE46A21|nr:class I SAM-dependent methyltransferase [Tahibacter sp.]HSX61012.1 class I SAM-dependent methyltransferase [Tahibacter sp.]
MIDALRRLIGELEGDRALLAPGKLRKRLDALDRFEHFPIGYGGTDALDPVIPAELRHRAATLRDAIEQANLALFEATRDAIRNGTGAVALRRWTEASARAGDDYDHLDALVAGVLQLDEPAPAGGLAAGMVSYQPTPARHIVDLVDRAGLSARDVLVDLGSGLGHVPLLAAILSGARGVGIEVEAAYVDCARRCAAALNLRGVRFVHADVRAADLSVGTIFHLYTPFTGAILDDVLRLLRREARTRALRIVTLGPCTPVVARERWLVTDDACELDRPVLFRSDGATSQCPVP